MHPSGWALFPTASLSGHGSVRSLAVMPYDVCTVHPWLGCCGNDCLGLFGAMLKHTRA